MPAGSAGRSQEELGGARRGQEEPGGARKSQEWPSTDAVVRCLQEVLLGGAIAPLFFLKGIYNWEFLKNIFYFFWGESFCYFEVPWLSWGPWLVLNGGGRW